MATGSNPDGDKLSGKKRRRVRKRPLKQMMAAVNAKHATSPTIQSTQTTSGGQASAGADDNHAPIESCPESTLASSPTIENNRENLPATASNNNKINCESTKEKSKTDRQRFQILLSCYPS